MFNALTVAPELFQILFGVGTTLLGILSMNWVTGRGVPYSYSHTGDGGKGPPRRTAEDLGKAHHGFDEGPRRELNGRRPAAESWLQAPQPTPEHCI